MEREDIPPLLLQSRLVPPPRRPSARLPIRDANEYPAFYQRSIEDVGAYWAGVARELVWSKPWHKDLEGSLPEFRFFVGGEGNVADNCIDRHLAERRNQAAILWEGEDGTERVWTYQRLHDETDRVANALKELGVQRGDVVGIFLPNLPETFAAVHACYRIGAVYNLIFSGFSAQALRDRLVDTTARVVLTADVAWRRGRAVLLKRTLDEALEAVPSVEHVICLRRSQEAPPWRDGRDLDWQAFVGRQSPNCPSEPLEANDPGFVIYTSGTSARPKGVVHSGLGFLVGAYHNVRWSLDLGPEDIYWCTADNGWLTFPIFALVGGLANGATCVVYEGALDHPGPDRFYRMVEKYRINKVFTAPTALRMLVRQGEELLAGRDLSSLELVSLVGEPFDSESWEWIHTHLGEGRVEINNTYGQSETGTAWTSSLVGVTHAKPGSCGPALPGYAYAVVDERGDPVPPTVTGYLTLTKPFPSLARTVFRDPGRYIEQYFSRYPGRYFTADASVLDPDGHVWVLGRVDDVINVAAHRLSTMEMESALLSHPAVAEAAVIGVQDEAKGQVPVAFVSLARGHEPGEELARALGQAVVDRIGPIARPRAVHVVDAMPKTRSGKIVRRLLKELVETGDVRGDMTGLEDPEVVQRLKSRWQAGA